MDLRPRFLMWIDVLMFTLGFGLAVWLIQAFASQSEPKPEDPAEQTPEVFEDKLQRASPEAANLMLRAAVQTALELEPLTASMPIKVTAEAGTIYLDGQVLSSRHRRAAVGVAKQTPGVTRVVDRLRINPQVPRELPPDPSRAARDPQFRNR